MFGGSSVGLNPFLFLQWVVLKLAASLPIHRSSQRSALGAARSVANIYCEQEKTREYCLIVECIFRK